MTSTDVILIQLPFLASDDLDRILAAIEVELRVRDKEEWMKQEYDDMLARQYEVEEV